MRDQSDFAAKHVGQFGSGFQLAFLRNLDCAHHLNRILGEKIRPLGIQLSVFNDETIDALGRGFGAR